MFSFSDHEYVNVNGLELREGKRYRVCIHANASTKHYADWRETLPEISKCSDGVVVDTLPPTTGNVWIERNTRVTYQVCVI